MSDEKGGRFGRLFYVRVLRQVLFWHCGFLLQGKSCYGVGRSTRQGAILLLANMLRIEFCADWAVCN